MWRPDAVCAEYCSPEGVTRSFQVCAYSIDPDGMFDFSRASNLSDSFSDDCRTRNLLSENEVGLALADESVEDGPEMSLIGLGESSTGDREWLAWTGSGPDAAILGPPRKLEGEAPSGDPGKEVTLGVPAKVGGRDICDASRIDMAGRDEVF